MRHNKVTIDRASRAFKLGLRRNAVTNRDLYWVWDGWRRSVSETNHRKHSRRKVDRKRNPFREEKRHANSKIGF